MGKYSIRVIAMLWFSNLITLHGKKRVIMAIHSHLREKKNEKTHKKGDCAMREIAHSQKYSPFTRSE